MRVKASLLRRPNVSRLHRSIFPWSFKNHGIFTFKQPFKPTMTPTPLFKNQWYFNYDSLDKSHDSICFIKLHQITSGDEARYAEQEERATKRMADEDSDYKDASIKSLSE